MDLHQNTWDTVLDDARSEALVPAVHPTPDTVAPSPDLVECPECGAPSEVRDRFVLDSTSGPVEHVRISCVRARHHLTMPVPQPREPESTTPPLRSAS